MPHRVPLPPTPRVRATRRGCAGGRVTIRFWCSLEGVFLCSVRPGGEGLIGAAVGAEAEDEALDVVGQVGRGDLESAHRAAEPGLVAALRGETAAEVHLEPWLLASVAVRQQLALETDVGGLDARAGGRASVHMQADRLRHLDPGETLLEFEHRDRCGLLGLDDRELAELEARAGDRGTPEEAGSGREAELVES